MTAMIEPRYIHQTRLPALVSSTHTGLARVVVDGLTLRWPSLRACLPSFRWINLLPMIDDTMHNLDDIITGPNSLFRGAVEDASSRK